MNPPNFSVIIPTFNRQEYLNEAISSVLSQTFEDFELIVVDDHGSSPASVPDDPRIHLIRADSNRGKSAAINLGLQFATGRYVAFLDDDDAWTCERLAHAAEAHKIGDVARCGMVPMDVEPRRTRERTGSATDGPGVQTRIARRREMNDVEMFGTMNSLSVRRELCLPFDVSFRASQDVEWSIRLRSLAPRVAVIESDDVLWRRHDGPRHGNNQSVRIEASKRLLDMHHEYYLHHRDQKSFRLYRLGVMLLRQGDHRQAYRYALRSFVAAPRIRTVVLAGQICRQLLSARQVSHTEVVQKRAG